MSDRAVKRLHARRKKTAIDAAGLNHLAIHGREDADIGFAPVCTECRAIGLHA
jgi:hypothetical protein